MAKEPLRPINQDKISQIEAKLTALDTQAGKAQLVSEKLAVLNAIPEEQLSESMRWLVANLKQRWQVADERLIDLERKSLQAEKQILQTELSENIDNG